MNYAIPIILVAMLAAGGGGDGDDTRPLQPTEVCLVPLQHDECPVGSIVNRSPGPQIRP